MHNAQGVVGDAEFEDRPAILRTAERCRAVRGTIRSERESTVIRKCSFEAVGRKLVNDCEIASRCDAENVPDLIQSSGTCAIEHADTCLDQRTVVKPFGETVACRVVQCKRMQYQKRTVRHHAKYSAREC